MSVTDENVIRESATVVLLREQPGGFQVLLLQKNASLNYGGSWVFPGGVAEDSDRLRAERDLNSNTRESIALATVLREAAEETGLQLDANQLSAFSNWLTPKLKIKRYNTLFFVGVLDTDLAHQAIKIDGAEIVASQWITPAEALNQQASQKMALNGPSYVTLAQLSDHTTAADAAESLCRDGVTWYEPRGTKTQLGVATVYAGDASYQEEVLNEYVLANCAGPRHRLYMNQGQPWKYEDSR